MIRKKNYSLIKAIRESGCCSKDDSSSGGAFDIDSIVKSLDIGYSSYEEIPTFNLNLSTGGTQRLTKDETDELVDRIGIYSIDFLYRGAAPEEYYCIATIPAQS